MTATTTKPIQWTDTSSYGQGETNRVPSTWTVQSGHLTITITRHIHFPGKWLLRTNMPGLDMVDLSTTNEPVTEAIKRDALKRVENYLAELQQDLECI